MSSVGCDVRGCGRVLGRLWLGLCVAEEVADGGWREWAVADGCIGMVAGSVIWEDTTRVPRGTSKHGRRRGQVVVARHGSHDDGVCPRSWDAGLGCDEGRWLEFIEMGADACLLSARVAMPGLSRTRCCRWYSRGVDGCGVDKGGGRSGRVSWTRGMVEQVRGHPLSPWQSW